LIEKKGRTYDLYLVSANIAEQYCLKSEGINMAIYHCTTKPISRSSGRSAIASSAYRTAQKIVDKQTGEIHDYTKKQGVIHTEIIPPKISILMKSVGKIYGILPSR